MPDPAPAPPPPAEPEPRDRVDPDAVRGDPGTEEGEEGDGV